MTLPAVDGWVIDFRTARAIFGSGSNERINHCVGLCGSGQLHICHCEKKLFKGDASLEAAFIDDNNCVWSPTDADMVRCLAIGQNPVASTRIKGNDAAIFITAVAAVNSLGVISDHRSFFFATVYDLCGEFGIPCLSADEYFDAL